MARQLRRWIAFDNRLVRLAQNRRTAHTRTDRYPEPEPWELETVNHEAHAEF
jgi:hypothetical protein